MADPTINVKLTAKDEASRVIQKANGEITKMSSATAGAREFVNGLGISFDNLASPAQLAGQALAKIGTTIKESVDTAAAYGKQVGDVARQLGVSTEEASKLIQVSDDLEIEFGALRMALKSAQKDGINPTIDGIKELAAQYQAIQSPTERAAFAMDKFGRSGIEMQKLLELTNAEIDDLIAGAEGVGLVLSEDAVQGALEYRQAVDGMNDAIEGLKIELGNQFMPVVTAVTNEVTDLVSVLHELNEITDDNAEKIKALYWAHQQGIITEKELYRGINDINYARDEQSEIVQRATEAAAAYNNSLSETIRLAPEYEDGHTRAASAVVTVTDAVTEETAAIVAETQSMQDYQSALLGVIDARQKYLNQATAFILAQLESQQQTRNRETERQIERADMRASGGPVMAGRAYVVGEQGPEVFAPTQNGMIIPAGASRATVNNYITAGNIDAQALAQALAMEIGRY